VYFGGFMYICRFGAFIMPQQQALSGLPFGIVSRAACKHSSTGELIDF